MQTDIQQFTLGGELTYEGKKCLVVRIVDHCCLFEIPLKRYVVDELYVELLSTQGESIFVSLRREVHDVERPPTTTMRGPEPIMKMAEDLV